MLHGRIGEGTGWLLGGGGGGGYGTYGYLKSVSAREM